MISTNKKVMIHAYKRNGWLYRTWEFPKVVDIGKDFICVSLWNCKIITNDKDKKCYYRSVNLKNAYWFFLKDKWYNIIATINSNNSISYYINIASPFIYEEEAIKYYDFDIDIKMDSSSRTTYKILDIDEFNNHRVIYNYERELTNQILKTSTLFKNINFRNKIFSKINIQLLKYYMKKN